MKVNKHLLIIIISCLSLSTFAQTSKKTLNYQAVILDPKAIDIPGASITGQPLNNGKVCLRFSLLNAQGGLDYEETQQVTTDEYGLVNVAIGAGTQAQSGNSTSIYKSFESVVWNSSVKSLKVSVSYDGCSSFKQVSSQALNYTPYALYAEAVDYKNVRDAPTKLSQFANDAGFLIPKDLDPLKADIQTNSSKIEVANKLITDNKKSSDAAFLIVNQSITSLDTKVAANTTAIKENTNSITNINTKLTDQQNQINDNRNQITATNNNLNTQIGGLQGQLNTTNSTVSNLTGTAELVSNKSTATNLGGANPSDQAYPSQRATKAYVDQSISQIATSGVPDATTLASGKIQLSGDLGGTASSPTVPALAGKENTSNKSTNVQTDATSDTKYPSVKAVKAYVDQATMGTALQATVDGKADKNSPTFTGTPVLPSGTTGVTQSASDNSTKLATTAFVQAATAGIALQASVDAKADKNSPTFTGTPVLPSGTIAVTQNSGDNSTNIATTAFVQQATAAGIIDASTSTKGKLKLSGDLGGTAEAPTVPGLALKANASDVNNSLALKEDASNKSNAALGTSTTLFPTQSAVKTYVDAQIASATISDADAVTKGKLQLAGDLGGTAAAPTVPGLALKANTTDVTNSLALKAPINNPTFTGTVGGITQNMVGLGNVDNTSDANKPVSTAAQTALNLKAPLASPTFTGTPSLPTGTTGVTQSANDNSTKLATTEFVTTSLAAGAPDATTTATGKVQLAGDLGGTAAAPTVPGLALKANTTDVTSSLALKAPINNPTFTGTVGGITQSMVGLANVDNTSDANKPVSAAAQTALNLKAPLASPTFTGTPSLPTGTTGVTQSANDNSTKLATTEFVTTSLAAGAPDATTTATGKVQLAGDLGGTAAAPTVPGLALKANTTDVTNSLALKAPIDNPTFTGTVAGITKTMVGLANVDNTSDADKPVSTAAQTALNLKANASDVTSSLALKAPLASPTFTGTPSLPTGTTGVTQSANDNSTKLATTAFVTSSVSAGAPDATTTATGKVQLAGELSGTATAPTLTNSAVIGKVLTGYSSAAGTISATDNILQAIQKLDGNDALKAPINNPAFTGTPLAPTATAGTNTTQIATTEFVTGAITTANATNANLTGPITSSGNATSVASQTGTGSKFVMDTSPTLVTPTIGVATATSVNKVSITAPANGSTLTIADGKTLTSNNSLTLAGTDATLMTFPSTNATIARTDAAQTFTGTQTFSSTIAGSITGNAATVTTNANLTGDVTSTGNATTIGVGKVTNSMLAGSIDLTSKVSGSLPIANGGTGASTATQNYIFAGPATGSSAGAPSFRALVAADLPKASTSTLGGIVVGTGLSMNSMTGVMDVRQASTSTLGGIVVGTGLSMNSMTGVMDVSKASTSTIGGVRVGTGLTVDPSTGIMSTSGSVTNSITFSSTGGAAAGATFNGSVAKTIDYSTVGASPLAGSSSLTTVGTIASGTWNGSMITSAFGGTGNGFTKFSGPTTSEKTFTLPDANATLARTDAAQTFTGTQTFSSPIAGSITGNAATVTTNANLTGDVTSTGNTTTIGVGKVTNSMLAGSIDLTSKVSGSLPIANGGTGVSTATQNYIFAGPATGSSAGAPSFRALVAADMPTLNQNTTGSAGSVTNAVTFATTGGASSGTSYNGSTARTIDYSTVGASPLAGSSSLTTVGTIASGTWNGSMIAAQYGGTGLTSYTAGDLLFASGSTTIAKLAKGTDGQVLTMASGSLSWANNNGITGNGNQNYLLKYNNAGGTSAGNSMIFDNGTSVGINNGSPGSSYKLDVNGAANFSNDIVVNGLIIGKRLDPGYGMYATSYGVNALANYVVGAFGSTAFGNNALQNNTSGAYNNAFGIGSLASLTTGSANTAIGSYASNETTSASNNVIIGHEAGRYLNTSENTIIGWRAGQTCCTTNSVNAKNTYIGSGSGNGTTGSNNVIIGSYGGGSFSNNIILADGEGNIRARHDGTKWTLNGLDTFSSNLTINGMIFGRITGTSNWSQVEGVLIGNANTKGNSISIGRNVLSAAGGDDNFVIGQDALSNSAGNPRFNTVLGNGAGANSPGGVYGLEGNVFIGRGAGAGTQGNSNLIIGNVAGGAFSNNIILADGDGTIRYRWDGTTNNFNTGSVTAASFKKSGGTSSQYLMADGSTSSGGGVTSISGGTTGLSPSTATTGEVNLAGTLVVANGGTGATTLTGYVKGSGTSALTASASIPVADVTGAAPLASPTLTGTPLAPTATAGTNTTQIATTQFVTSAITTANATNANLTGPITSTGNATSVASQTGTGTKFVMDTSPTLVTPTLGVATAISVNKVAITTPATSATLTIADGKTLSVTNNTTISGTNTGDQTITLTGAVTGSGTGSFLTSLADAAVTSGKIADGAIVTADLANSAVSYAKIQNVTAGKLLGSINSSAAAPGEVTIGTGLSLSSSGTLTASGSGGTVTSIGLSVGTSGTDVSVSGSPITSSGSITLNIPSASATARGLVTTSAQTFAGDKTFSNNLTVSGNTSVSGSLTGGGGGALAGFDVSLNNNTGTTYTLADTDRGKVVTLDNSSTITVTIPSSLSDGFNCLIVQKGLGKITFSGSGVTLINRQSHTKTAGRYAVVTIVDIGSNQVILAGDTGN